MKMTHAYQKAQENMRPGVITAEGFLGHDQRPIVDIIEQDEETMSKIGLSFEQLVSAMRLMLDKGQKGLGEPITIDNTWLVRVDETRGLLPSPFEEDGVYHKVNVEVECVAKPGKLLVYNELCLHLIEKYHFFQGNGSPFRIEPVLAKEILCL